MVVEDDRIRGVTKTMSHRVSPNIAAIPLSLTMLLAACGLSSATATTQVVPTEVHQNPASAPTAELQPTITQMLPTPTIAATETLEKIGPTGRIFFWDDRFPAAYSTLQVGDLFSPSPLLPASQSAPGPDQAVALAFANYSTQVAYLTYSEKLELQIADLELSRIETATVDDQQWLKDSLDLGEAISFYWGPGDKTIIISRRSSESAGIVYSVSSGKIDYLSEGCRELAVSPQSQRLAPWCRLRDQAQGYLVLEWDGQLRKETSLPSAASVQIVESVFSPNGNQALFADDNGKIGILKNGGSRSDIPVRHASDLWGIPLCL